MNKNLMIIFYMFMFAHVCKMEVDGHIICQYKYFDYNVLGKSHTSSPECQWAIEKLMIGMCPALFVFLCTVKKPVPAGAGWPATAASIVKTTEQSTRLFYSEITEVLISDQKSLSNHSQDKEWSRRQTRKSGSSQQVVKVFGKIGILPEVSRPF